MVMRGRFGKPNSEQEFAPLDARALRLKAIASLARREHSRAELTTKLARFSADEALIAQVLDGLVAEKLLSDARFAEGIARMRGSRHGSGRVAQELRTKGVDQATAAPLVAQVESQDLERAQALWLRKFGEPATDANGRAKQMRFLQARGFPADVIHKVVPSARTRRRDEDEGDAGD